MGGWAVNRDKGKSQGKKRFLCYSFMSSIPAYFSSKWKTERESRLRVKGMGNFQEPSKNTEKLDM